MRKLKLTLLMAVGLTAVPTQAPAQVNKVLWIVQGGHVRDVVATTGFRWVYTPSPVIRTDPATGVPLPVTSRTSLHASATGGVSIAAGRDRTFDWVALGSLGFVKPIGAGPISGAGLIAMAALQPDGVGPGLRIETGFQAIGLNAGVLLGAGTTRGAAVLDLSGTFLRDLFR